MLTMLLIFCTISSFIVAGSCALTNQNRSIDYRLNTDILPIEYIVDLTPYFDGSVFGKTPFTFDGIVTIAIKSIRPNVDTITVHKQDLNIHDVSVRKQSGISPFPGRVENIAVKSNDYDNITHKLMVKLVSPLVQNALYELKFSYTGNLRTDMTGFYRSSYTEGNDTK